MDEVSLRFWRDNFTLWKRSRHIFVTRPDGYQCRSDVVTRYPAVRRVLKCHEKAGLDRAVASDVSCSLGKARRQTDSSCHSGPRPSQETATPCMYLSQSDCLSVYLPAAPQLHGFDTTFLGPNKKCLMKEHNTIQPSLYGIEVDWSLVTEIWSSQTETLETHF